jgi:membrane dipeptidase
MPHSPLPVFDGHNDVLLRSASLRRQTRFDPSSTEKPSGHIDLPRARAGGLAGGLCAIYVPSPSMEKDANGDFPTPAQPHALNETLAMARMLFDIETQSERRAEGVPHGCRDPAIDQCRQPFAAVLHIEGAEAIAGVISMRLHVLHHAGLRTLGPVWSRPNIFAYGVPFRFPSTRTSGRA